MHVKIKFSFQVVRAELPEADGEMGISNCSALRIKGREGCERTYWASSQVTIFERPILYVRVKKASAVKTRGAIINSYSSKVDSREDWEFG